jgi:hypothetical protein
LGGEGAARREGVNNVLYLNITQNGSRSRERGQPERRSGKRELHLKTMQNGSLSRTRERVRVRAKAKAIRA